MSSKPSSTHAASPAPKRRTGLIVGLALLFAVGAAGAAAWVMQRPAPEGDEFDVQAASKLPAPIFVPLEQFTVNLADPGGERLAQVGITLEVANAKVEAATKAQMPAVRNSVLLLLSASQSSELLTVAGKQLLARQIAELTGQHLGWEPSPQAAAGSESSASEFVAQRQSAPQRSRPNPIQAVHFSHFIIQ